MMSQNLSTENKVLNEVIPFGDGVLKRLENGKTIYLIPQLFNYRLAIGWTHEEDTSCDDFYCYINQGTAIVAFYYWNGEGDPLDGWIRHGKSGRRRPDGDKEKEYIRF